MFVHSDNHGDDDVGVVRAVISTVPVETRNRHDGDNGTGHVDTYARLQPHCKIAVIRMTSVRTSFHLYSEYESRCSLDRDGDDDDEDSYSCTYGG